MTPDPRPGPRWPGGAAFAFSIFDDTDMTTLLNGPPVYDAITAAGLRITKTVWPVLPDGPARTGGTTCDDADYRAWALDLQAAGHEIGIHNASDHPSKRPTTERALDRFAEIFGHDPRIGADHVGNFEAMYWGSRRLTGLRSHAYALGTRAARPNRRPTEGEIPTSEYFWGDLLRDRVDYWRNFTYHDIDTLHACPPMPYHDPVRPYVNWWFAASHAPTADAFVELLAPERLDRLEAQGGACILYTHLGLKFTDPDGVPDPRVVEALQRVAERRGWFAPVSAILDHLRTERAGDAPLTGRERSRLENRWITDQVSTRAGAETRRVLRRVRGIRDPY
ncbi:hypothetical protein [Aquihabitans sp. McL0605]|uniref:hypothetical protein n=1 Tax=Aquihabitans sp. McL0605 TaxID=3415671 RepID=UPI003CED834A